jgi:hypothetical protein
MAKDEGRLHSEVAIASVEVVVEVAAAEASGNDPDLDLARRWWPDGSLLHAEVFGTVEDDCSLGGHFVVAS